MALFGMIAGCGSHALGALAQIPLNLIFVTYFLSAVLYGAIGLGLLSCRMGRAGWSLLLAPSSSWGRRSVTPFRDFSCLVWASSAW
jgi:hypothetical protein